MVEEVVVDARPDGVAVDDVRPQQRKNVAEQVLHRAADVGDMLPEEVESILLVEVEARIVECFSREEERARMREPIEILVPDRRGHRLLELVQLTGQDREPTGIDRKAVAVQDEVVVVVSASEPLDGLAQSRSMRETIVVDD